MYAVSSDQDRYRVLGDTNRKVHNVGWLGDWTAQDEQDYPLRNTVVKAGMVMDTTTRYSLHDYPHRAKSALNPHILRARRPRKALAIAIRAHRVVNAQPQQW